MHRRQPYGEIALRVLAEKLAARQQVGEQFVVGSADKRAGIVEFEQAAIGGVVAGDAKLGIEPEESFADRINGFFQ